MGYEHHHQRSTSSAALVAVVVLVLVLGVLGLLAVGGVTMFWVRTERMEAQAVAAEHQALHEFRRAEALARQNQAEQPAAPATQLDIRVKLDPAGKLSVAGEEMSLDGLRDHLNALKQEAGNAILLKLDVAAECPVKYVVPVLNLCKEMGDVDSRLSTLPEANAEPEARVES